MSRPVLSELFAQRLVHASVFGALGAATRLSIVAKLCAGRPHSIVQLTEDTKLTRQAVTKHLRVLEHAGIVHSSRVGRESRFSFNPKSIEDIRRYLELVCAQWDAALDRPPGEN